MNSVALLFANVYTDSPLDGFEYGSEPVVFYHKNGEFREKEATVYSDLATGKNQPKKGLFRSLVNTRGNRMMFFTMLLCFALVMGVSLLGKSADSCTVGGAQFKISAFSFDQTVFVSISVDSSGVKEPFLVNADIFALDAGGAEADSEHSSYEVSAQGGAEQFIRATFSDFDLKTIRCVLSGAEKNAELTCKIQHK